MSTTLSPYDSNVKQESGAIEQFLKFFPFRDLQPWQKDSIKGILEYHARCSSYNPGDIVARRGAYGESALFVLSGSAHVVYGLKSENRNPDSSCNGYTSLPWIGRATHRMKNQLNSKGVQTLLDKNEHSSFEVGDFKTETHQNLFGLGLEAIVRGVPIQHLQHQRPSA